MHRQCDWQCTRGCGGLRARTCQRKVCLKVATSYSSAADPAGGQKAMAAGAPPLYGFPAPLAACGLIKMLLLAVLGLPQLCSLGLQQALVKGTRHASHGSYPAHCAPEEHEGLAGPVCMHACMRACLMQACRLCAYSCTACNSVCAACLLVVAGVHVHLPVVVHMHVAYC